MLTHPDYAAEHCHRLECRALGAPVVTLSIALHQLDDDTNAKNSQRHDESEPHAVAGLQIIDQTEVWGGSIGGQACICLVDVVIAVSTSISSIADYRRETGNCVTHGGSFQRDEVTPETEYCNRSSREANWIHFCWVDASGVQ